MINKLLAAFILCLCGGLKSWAEQPLTIDIVHQQHSDIGQTIRLADGRVLIEFIRPVANVSGLILHHSSRQTYNRTHIHVIDPNERIATVLFPQESNEAFEFGGRSPLSPNGEGLLVLKSVGERLYPGVFDLTTGKLHTFPDITVTRNDRTTRWISDEEFIVLSDRSSNGYFAYGGRYLGPVFQAAAWAKAWEQEAVTASELGSGAYETRPSTNTRSIVVVNVVANTVRSVVDEEFIGPVSPSPDGRFLIGKFEYPTGSDLTTQNTPLRMRLLDIENSEFLDFENSDCAIQSVHWNMSSSRFFYLSADECYQGGKQSLRYFELTKRRGGIDKRELSGKLLDFNIERHSACHRQGESRLERVFWFDESTIAFALRPPEAASVCWYTWDVESETLQLLVGPPESWDGPVAVSRSGLFFLNGGSLFLVNRGGQIELLETSVEMENVNDTSYQLSNPGAPPSIKSVLFSTATEDSTVFFGFNPAGQVSRYRFSEGSEARLTGTHDHGKFVTINNYGSSSLLYDLADESTEKVILEYNLYLTEVVQPKAPQTLRFNSGEHRDLIAYLFLSTEQAVSSDGKYPLVVIVYPETVYAENSTPLSRAGRPWDVSGVLIENAQLYASAGYAVLLPSIPLTDGPSDPMIEMMPPIEDSVAAAIQTGLIDENRLALVGHSFGGYAALSVAVQSNTFDAIVASAAASNLISLYGEFRPNVRFDPFFEIDFYGRVFLESGQNRMGKPPWRDVERYVRNSPLFHVKEVATPILMFHGDLDWLPISQSEEFFTALVREGKDAKFVRYWGEPHSAKRPQNHRDMWYRTLDFLYSSGVTPGLKKVH